MVQSLPRCGGCSRAIRGRQKDTCTPCNNNFHKKCSGRDVRNLYIHYQRNWLCQNCANASGTPSTLDEDSSILDNISARALNERFSDINPEETDNEFDILLENSIDRYYEPEDLNNILCTSNSGDFFTMCINIRGLNIQKISLN